MSRKNIFEGVDQAERSQAEANVERPRVPLIFGAGKNVVAKSLSQSMEAVAKDREELLALREEIAKGERIVDIDPAQIEPAPFSDRLDVDVEDAEFADLVASIAADGQQVPVLLRPHPQKRGIYQTGYGGRRIRAARKLGKSVRAVVKELTDAELALAQGQENTVRKDTTFIERALWADELRRNGIELSTIMGAVRVDRAKLSQMFSIIADLPREVVLKVGRAPGIGRRKWEDLAKRIKLQGEKFYLKALETPDFLGKPSTERFEYLFALERKPKSGSGHLGKVFHLDGIGRIEMLRNAGGQYVLKFNPAASTGFAPFVVEELEALGRRFLEQEGRLAEKESQRR